MAVIVVTGANSGIGRATAGVSDADWLALGAAATDDEYFDRFDQAFGLDIRGGDVRTDAQRAAGK